MRSTLTFVHGAVALREQAVPTLTHFRLADARIQGFNGRLAIDAPLDLGDISACVPANKFLTAVDACEGEPAIAQTEGGRLSISKGRFRAALPILDAKDFPHASPSKGERVSIDPGALLSPLSVLRPFIGEDATRQWCLTMVADGSNVYATNSSMIASYPVRKGLVYQLPVFVIDELLRVSRVFDDFDPESYAKDETSITFFYAGDCWLRSQLIVDPWPVERAASLLDGIGDLAPIPDDLVAGIKSLVPFCADPKMPMIHFTERGISTTPGETQAEIEGAGWPAVRFDVRNLLPMLNASSHFGINAETGHGMFRGEGGFRGVMMGAK